jgi:type VI secretion system protein ImpG
VRDELLSYYERELTYFRQMGAEFAERYPKVASRLLLEPNRCEDPHVERLIEATAFLAARVHLKIDDEFPELSESLLTVLYPHYIRPIPSMSIVQFHMDPEQGKSSSGLTIPRNSMLYSRPVEGFPCKFRTCYDTTIWPLTLTNARWITPDRLSPPVKLQEQAVAALCVELTCLPDVDFTKVSIPSLRFHLNGESSFVHSLYELLCNNCVQIQLRDMAPNSHKPPIQLETNHLVPVGFKSTEAMFPYPSNSFTGYRLLQEYFAFPEKFFFLDLTGLEALSKAAFGSRVEIVFLIERYERAERQQVLELNVTPKAIALNCSPIVNLFPLSAEPILLDHTRFEYPVVPDARRQLALEVFSVDEVSSIDRDSHDVVQFHPFYRSRHASTRKETLQQAFWCASRKPSVRRNDEGTDVFLTLMDLSGRPTHPDFDTITVRCTCSNRDLAHRLPLGSPSGDFEIEGIPALKRSVALRKPTVPVRPPWGKGVLWRLISHLSLNYLSLVEEGREAFQEILRLYNFSGSPHLEKQITGIHELSSKRHFARVVSDEGIGFVRGRQIQMVFDEEQFVGGGVYLFASVIEHFLGLYASLNSFSQLAAFTLQRKEPLRQWQPRAGQVILL